MLGILGQIILTKTRFGREILAIGGNKETAYFAGLKVEGLIQADVSGGGYCMTQQKESITPTSRTRTSPFDYVRRGSVDPEDIRARFRSVVECDWAWMAKLDHDFVGREAVEAEIANPKRKLATLEFNADDLADVYRSQCTEAPYKYMGMPSADPTYSAHFHTMISHAIIDADKIEEGKEVLVRWGEYGKRVKNLRAKIARFPYIHGVMDNWDQDLSIVPSGI